MPETQGELAKRCSAQMRTVLQEFFEKIELEEGDMVVLGLSTSEVAGGSIGKDAQPAVGRAAVDVAMEMLREQGCDLAVQCCEHLNRALVVERAAMKRRGLSRVSVLPSVHAGGSAATAAYELFIDPVVVEAIQAEAAIDVGVTMVGMHIKPVVVPVRTSLVIGKARVDFCYARPKLIGGERAHYAQEK